MNLKIEEGTLCGGVGPEWVRENPPWPNTGNAIALPEGGTVTVFGMDTQDEGNLIPIRRTVGMVFQNPDNQIVANVVEEDVAFAPENLGVPSQEIRRRVDEALQPGGPVRVPGAMRPISSPAGKSSGSPLRESLPCEPECIVLDEPTAMLDPRGRRRGYGDCLRLEPAHGHHRRAHHPPHG